MACERIEENSCVIFKGSNVGRNHEYDSKAALGRVKCHTHYVDRAVCLLSKSAKLFQAAVLSLDADYRYRYTVLHSNISEKHESD